MNDLNEPGFEKREVQKFIKHPNWKPLDADYNADVAIIVMDAPVEYSQYIRPICIWTFSSDLTEFVGQRGIIAGISYLIIMTSIYY